MFFSDKSKVLTRRHCVGGRRDCGFGRRRTGGPQLPLGRVLAAPKTWPKPSGRWHPDGGWSGVTAMKLHRGPGPEWHLHTQRGELHSLLARDHGGRSGPQVPDVAPGARNLTQPGLPPGPAATLWWPERLYGVAGAARIAPPMWRWSASAAPVAAEALARRRGPAHTGGPGPAWPSPASNRRIHALDTTGGPDQRCWPCATALRRSTARQVLH